MTFERFRADDAVRYVDAAGAQVDAAARRRARVLPHDRAREREGRAFGAYPGARVDSVVEGDRVPFDRRRAQVQINAGALAVAVVVLDRVSLERYRRMERVEAAAVFRPAVFQIRAASGDAVASDRRRRLVEVDAAAALRETSFDPVSLDEGGAAVAGDSPAAAEVEDRRRPRTNR